ncbi:hypothetical protein N0M98_09910 [Paenibacillus doosanensis]|uniref:hypothetical protein n=1 Tax=Paenibacillus doosanensis TaxID=1229154 RepID=UPI0021804881|nr:hypothetical protein [Paenibacillus doosanensis]MCS7460454.1 hypothetical protein [Paenibacillus doosanensis]
MIIPACTVLLWILLEFSILLTRPAQYHKRRPMVMMAAGVLAMIAAIVYYVVAQRPRVGPIGNGPDLHQIWVAFLYLTALGGCLFTAGIIIWSVHRSWRTKQEAGSAESFREHGEKEEEASGNDQ